jgi:hypothetical protein
VVIGNAVSVKASVRTSGGLGRGSNTRCRYTVADHFARKGAFERIAIEGVGSMSNDYKIYVDGSRPATFNNGAGALTDCATLQEAVLAGTGWHPSRRYERP